MLIYPFNDISNRMLVWSAMSGSYVDNELSSDQLKEIAKICSNSPYSLRELEKIMFTEVWPAFASNLFSHAGEWAGWSDDEIKDRIIKSYRKRFYLSWCLSPFKLYFCGKWSTIEKGVAQERRALNN